MKKKQLLFCISLIFACLNIYAQHRGIPDFTNLYDPAATCYYGDFWNPKANVGIMPQRHRMISTPGFDPNTDNRLPIIPEGENQVIKLGNDMIEAKAEAITYRFEVDPYLSILLLKFAVVFQDPGEDHQPDERPRFMVKVTNLNEQLVDSCAIYDVTAYGDVEGFIQGIEDDEVRWRPWTSVGIDLTTYIGQEIIVEFDTYDCADGAHYGYAYYTASCIPNRFEFSNCTNPITITAPAFFQSYQWNNGSTTQSSQYTVGEGAVDVECYITSVTGCDFTLTAQLAFDVPIVAHDTIIHDTTCIRSPYNKHYFDLPAFEVPGNYAYVKTLLDLNNCKDHTITLILNVKDKSPDGIYYDSICLNEPYQRYGFDTIGLPIGLHELQRDTISPTGCDSTIRVLLNVMPIYDTTFADTTCFGEGYHKHGFDYDSIFLSQFVGTTFYDSTLYQSISGCDSMVRIELIVGQTYDTTFFDSICFGEGYHLHGFDFDSLGVGDYYDTLPLLTTLGCDSITRLYLTVNPVYDTLFTDTICFGEDYYKHGFEIDTPSVGLRLDTLPLSSIFGCDSVVRLSLLVAPVYDTTLYDTTCSRDYHQHGFDLDSLSLEPFIGTTFYDTMVYPTIFGCDSVVKLELVIGKIYDTTFYDSICFGEEYHLHGFDLDSLGVGLHYDTLPLITYLGCDSIVRLYLTVNPSYDTLFSDTICFGESYHEHGFELDSLPSGWHADTLVLYTTLGCDSIVRLNLLVTPVYDTAFSDMICVGESYHGHGFDLDSLEVGLHRDTLNLLSIFGCDSTITLELIVNPTYDTLFFDTICHGDGYHEHGFDLDSVPAEWSHHTLTLSTVFGCDSVTFLELYAAPTYDTLFIDTICHGESYHEHGFDLDSLEVGLHHEIMTMKTVLYCDSIVRLNLFVAPQHDLRFRDTICYGQSYHKYGFDVEHPEVGTYHEEKAFSNVFGCDSLRSLDLLIGQNYYLYVNDTTCENQYYTNYGMNLPPMEADIYYLISELETMAHCDSIFYITLKVVEEYDEPQNIQGDSLLFVATNMFTGRYLYVIDTFPECDQYEWTLDSSALSNKWILTPNYNTCEVSVQHPGEGNITVRAANRCGDISQSMHLNANYYGINEDETVKAVVYPNPCRNMITIESENIEEVNVINTTGVMVMSEKFERENRVTLNLGSLPSAVYLLEVFNSEGKCMRRIMLNNN